MLCIFNHCQAIIGARLKSKAGLYGGGFKSVTLVRLELFHFGLSEIENGLLVSLLLMLVFVPLATRYDEFSCHQLTVTK